MKLVSTIALVATAVHCAQAAPERKLLRTGYGSDLDFSTLTESTASDISAALSSTTNLLPTGSGTSAILPSAGSLASLTAGSKVNGLAGITSLTGNTGLSSIGGLSSLGDLSSITGLSSLSLPTGSTTTGTGLSNLLDTATG
ncbi:hypothetical protein DVH05_012727 [Phytophthora capsici]|nr:hypothetical protein DVH05_012727 [Phytophthora capsici]